MYTHSSIHVQIHSTFHTGSAADCDFGRGLFRLSIRLIAPVQRKNTYRHINSTTSFTVPSPTIEEGLSSTWDRRQLLIRGYYMPYSIEWVRRLLTYLFIPQRRRCTCRRWIRRRWWSGGHFCGPSSLLLCITISTKHILIASPAVCWSHPLEITTPVSRATNVWLMPQCQPLGIGTTTSHSHCCTIQ